METTLTINLPARQGVRAGAATDPPQLKKEPKDPKSLSTKKTGDHKIHNVSYKDKFQKMREKYDKVTQTHEHHSRDLDHLNSKIKKLQAENDLLLDSLYVAEPDLFARYFPAESSPTHGVPPPPGLATQGAYPSSNSTMAPPPPPPSAMSASSSVGLATGATPASQQQPAMPPPLPPMPMPMAPPPTSATSNGTTTPSARAPNSHSHSHSHSHSYSSRRQQSGESSSQGGRVPTERRRRSDATPRTPTHAHRSSGSGMPLNGLRSPQTHRRQSDVAPPAPMMSFHEDEIMAERERERERDSFRREPPPMNEEGGYNAYATVNSPDEDEEDEDDATRAKMDMDA